MAITEEEAIALLVGAGVDLHAPDEEALPAPRLRICRLLMAICHYGDPGLPLLGWNTLLSRLPPGEDLEDLAQTACDAFGLDWHDTEGVYTFGDLALYIEARLRKLWRGETGCASQAVFYALRRTVEERSGQQSTSERLRPETRLRDCLPADQADGVLAVVLRERFGIERVPVSLRVLGHMEFGATWLALWFMVVVYLVLAFTGPGINRAWFLPAFFGSAILVALALRLLSRRVWTGVRTLGDLALWVVRRNTQTVAKVREALRVSQPGFDE